MLQESILSGARIFLRAQSKDAVSRGGPYRFRVFDISLIHPA
jgi:hypothetical protein